MRRTIIGLSDRLDRLCRGGASAAVIAMVVLISIQVVSRYVLRAPPAWTEELARFAMVWGGLLGATIAFKLRFDPVLIRLPDRGSAVAAAAMALLRAVAVLTFLAPVLYFSLFGPGLDLDRGFLARTAARTADTLGFQMIYVAAAVPIAVAVILVHLAAQLAGDDAREEPH